MNDDENRMDTKIEHHTRLENSKKLLKLYNCFYLMNRVLAILNDGWENRFVQY